MTSAPPGQALADNASSTGDWVLWLGGKGTFFVTITGTAGTVTLEVLGADGATEFTAGSETTLTADGWGNFEAAPCWIRAAIDTATGVYAKVGRIPSER